MDSALIQSICSQVYRKHPEVNGKKPKVQSRPGNEYLLTFQGSAKTADGKTLPCTVRVVASAEGRILQITSSK